MDWEKKIIDLGSKHDKRLAKSQEEMGQLFRDYQHVFLGSDEGQRVLWDLLDQTYLFFPYEQQNASAYSKEGRREIGLYLLAAIGFRPDSGSLANMARLLMGQTIRKQGGK